MAAEVVAEVEDSTHALEREQGELPAGPRAAGRAVIVAIVAAELVWAAVLAFAVVMLIR
jgi:hypothetical protein